MKMKKRSKIISVFLFAQSHGSLQARDPWDIKGGYATWCHDLLCSPLLAAASGDFKALEKGVPLLPHVELGGGMGTMLAPKLLLRASLSVAALPFILFCARTRLHSYTQSLYSCIAQVYRNQTLIAAQSWRQIDTFPPRLFGKLLGRDIEWDD